jgi:hypothetical protein
VLHHRQLRLSEAVVGRLSLLLLRLSASRHVTLQQDLLLMLYGLLWHIVSLAVHHLDEAAVLW